MLRGNKPRQLGSLCIEGRCHPTTQSSVFGTDQAIGEIGSSIFPDKNSFLDCRLILELNIGRIEQARDGFND